MPSGDLVFGGGAGSVSDVPRKPTLLFVGQTAKVMGLGLAAISGALVLSGASASVAGIPGAVVFQGTTAEVKGGPLDAVSGALAFSGQTAQDLFLGHESGAVVFRGTTADEVGPIQSVPVDMVWTGATAAVHPVGIDLTGYPAPYTASLPLTAPLPLRTTAAWGAFRDAQVIPHRYGRVTGSLLQYDDSRRLFVWADHPSSAVVAVYVDGVQVQNWDWRNDLDVTGRGVTIVEFGSPADEGAVLTAEGVGKRHPRTGGLMTNPADIVWDIRAGIAGQQVDEFLYHELRTECGRMGIALAGGIAEVQSIGGQIAEVMGSVGALWTTDSAMVWPGGEESEPVRHAVDGRDRAAAEALSHRMANAVTVHYAYRDGRPRAAVLIEAPDSIRDHGRHEAVIDARWVSDRTVAVALGTRHVEHYARPVWAVRAHTRVLLSVGDRVNVGHPLVPVSGSYPVRDATIDLAAEETTITVEAPAGPVPRITLTSLAVGIEPDVYAGAIVDTAGDQRIITVTDSDGQPLPGATVAAHGVTRVADAGGRVSFPVHVLPAGSHILTVTGPGLEFAITVSI